MDVIFQPPGDPVQQAVPPMLGRADPRPTGERAPQVHPQARSQAPGWDHDTLTLPEISVRASPRGPSPVAPVFPPLPGSCSAVGVTSLTCPRSKGWTLRGCDPSGAQGALDFCSPGRSPRHLSSLEPGLVRAGTRPTLGHELTHLNCFPKEITLTMGSSNCPQHSD